MGGRRGRNRLTEQLEKAQLRIGSTERVLEEQRQSLRALEDKVRLLGLAPTGAAAAGTSAAPALPMVPDPAPVASSIPVAELLPSPALLEAPAVASSAPAPATPPEASTLEEKIALVWFTRIGALALLFGVAFFFKYAVDNDWIGPLGRVALGTVAGLAVLGFAELTGARTKAVYLQVLLGVGLAFLFVSAYASYALYHLVPMPAAFAAIGVVTLLGGALAIRHRGEGVLVLSLLAGFFCPVLLSTGKDLPLGLFSYLLLLTTLGFATSVRMGFRYATWLGMAGTALLFGGWYAKFFDADAPVLQEQSYEGKAIFSAPGKYFPLAARTVPLAAAAAFTALWLAAQRFARASPFKRALQPLAFLVVTLVLAHVGFSALLFDRALILSAVLAGLALLSAILLGLEERRELLGIPLVASLLVLLFCAHNARTEPGGVLAVLGLTGVIYSGAILRGRSLPALRTDATSLALISGVGIGLAVVSAVLLLDAHPITFVFVLAAISLAYASFALVSGAAAVAGGAIALSFAGLLIAESPREHHGPLFLVAAGVWAAIYFATAAYDLLVRRAEATAARIFTLSGAGLGFAAIALVNSAASDWLLRASVLVAIGALDLAVGATLLRRGMRQAATILLGQALGLFAAAAATLFSGATVTLIWAALAAVVAVLAAAGEDPQWLAGAVLLFLFAVLRAFSVDFEVPDEQRRLFFSSLGREGALRPVFLFNGRSIALGGTAVALLIPARAMAKRSADFLHKFAFAFATAAHLLLLVLCVFDARELYFKAPALVRASALNFSLQYDAAMRAQSDTLSMVTTVVMSIYAALLVLFGFAARNKSHRFLGLGLFAIALLKLVAWDVWHLKRIEQMVVLIAMGALLLGSSFLYARFGKRLVTLLRDGELHSGPAAVFLLLAGALASTQARAVEPARFTHVRTIEGVNVPGLYRAEIDPDLYAASQRALADIRIAGPGGEAIPFFVREVAATQQRVVHEATIVDPVALPDGSTRAVLDLGQPGLKHSEVDLQIEGSDFLRRTRIESSTDEVNFARLREGALVYRATSGAKQSEGMRIIYPLSDARYLRVTLLPGADRQALQITGAHLAETTEASRAPTRSLEVPISFLSRKADSTSTRFLIDMGRSGIPVDALALEVSTPQFERRVSVESSDDDEAWATAGYGLIYRAPQAEGLALRFPASRARYFRLEIEDGDNPPLTFRSAHASYRQQELVLRASSPGLEKLYAGEPKLDAPSYDLNAILARARASSGDVLEIREAKLGPMIVNPDFLAAKPAEKAVPFSERYKRPLVALLAVLVVGLALWTVRLLRTPAQSDRS